ncbi:hypothetical protein MOV76_05345 [Rhizobium sp. PRIMUS64]|uniref:hypothetical protein n=1 Tax=Rhizobium sp. PRIMUS64 TaxID=2908925 RepID=UPI001FF679D1|nr:hypothetical protein [Rhizobium sp. PRIMUS64]MCJ9691059.1 hypothetical protein [Rhizobium sp. PRIMUS64]
MSSTSLRRLQAALTTYQILDANDARIPERAFCFNPEDDQHVDYFVKIEIGGCIIHFDKAKYEESILLGIERDVGDDFFIERVNPGNASV